VSTLLTSIPDACAAIAQARTEGKAIGLIPTRGSLHAGHRSLLDRARQECDFVVVAIVGDSTTTAQQESDLALCNDAGADLVLAATPEQIHDRIREQVSTEQPSPFVAMTLTILPMLQPDKAYFGEKDVHQLALIRRMIHDMQAHSLNVPVEIVACPTVREKDGPMKGVAISSRNLQLSQEEKKLATVLPIALFAARDLIRSGERRPDVVVQSVAQKFRMDPRTRLEFFSVVDPETLQPVDHIQGTVLITAAMWLGDTRLVDHMTSKPLF
jgi:pantothenate synthetase